MTNAAATTNTARQMLGDTSVEPLEGAEPPAKIIIDPALPEALSTGRVVTQYYSENIHIAFHTAAVARGGQSPGDGARL